MQVQTQPSYKHHAPFGLVFNIAPSKVHGRGLIAARDIAKGETIGLAVGFKARHPLLTDMAKHINHSGEPNCRFKLIEGNYYLVATRIIKAEEEILADYNATPAVVILARPDFD